MGERNTSRLVPDISLPLVQLTDGEYDAACQFAAKKEHLRREQHAKEAEGIDQVSIARRLSYNMTGFAGHFAACKLFDRPLPVLGKFDKASGDVAGYELKTAPYWLHSLLVTERESLYFPNRKFLFCVELRVGRTYVFPGWIFGHEASVLGTQRSVRSGSTAYFVRQMHLRNLLDP